MTGNVVKDGDTWMYKVFGGKAKGKNFRRQKRGFISEKEAMREMTLTMESLEKEIEILKSVSRTLNDVFSEFIAIEAPSSRKYATIERYSSVYTGQ